MMNKSTYISMYTIPLHGIFTIRKKLNQANQTYKN